VSLEGHRGVRRPASPGGAGLLPILAILVLLPGCQPDDGGARARAEDEARAVGLPSGAVIHRVNLGGRGSEEHAVPALIRASEGDGVEFVSVDHRVHTVEFLPDSLTSDVRTFLESTGQMASPPLVDRGSRFVLKLQNAPQGRYFFRSEGHGGMAHGVVEVGSPPVGDSSRASPMTGV
jgi:plastocyanin